MLPWVRTVREFPRRTFGRYCKGVVGGAVGCMGKEEHHWVGQTIIVWRAIFLLGF